MNDAKQMRWKPALIFPSRSGPCRTHGATQSLSGGRLATDTKSRGLRSPAPRSGDDGVRRGLVDGHICNRIEQPRPDQAMSLVSRDPRNARSVDM